MTDGNSGVTRVLGTGMRLPAVTVLWFLLAASPASAVMQGLWDDPAFTNHRTEQRGEAFAHAREAGARVVRLTAVWSQIAPRNPSPRFDAGDPASQEYSWDYLDQATRAAKVRARRVRLMLTIVRAPAWAEGDGRPEGTPSGSWRPDPRALAAFSRAAAKRYSGFFADPKFSDGQLREGGRALPQVRYWQIWDEPNAGRTLLPIDGSGEDSPGAHYRVMLHAASRAITRVDDSNVVVSAGTARASAGGMAPLAFWRQVLCLDSAGARTEPCPGPLRFDGYAHHPATENQSPSRRARGDDLGVPDLGRLRRLVRRASAANTVDGARQLWVTRIGWTRRSKDPRGLSDRVRARYLARAFTSIARSDAEARIIWHGLRDTTVPADSIFSSVFSGLYLPRSNSDIRRDRPTRPLRAFRLPLVVMKGERACRARGVVARGKPTTVNVQLRSGGRWRRVARVRTSRDGVFSARVRCARSEYRARAGGITSAPWKR